MIPLMKDRGKIPSCICLISERKRSSFDWWTLLLESELRSAPLEKLMKKCFVEYWGEKPLTLKHQKEKRFSVETPEDL